MFGYITKVYHSDYGTERGVYLSSCINLIWGRAKTFLLSCMIIGKIAVTFYKTDPLYKTD